MKLNRSKWTLSHTMPAFIGNATKSGDWRIPSFKGALRHWWRLTTSGKDTQITDYRELSRREGRLFGQASDADTGATKSPVRIAFDDANRPLTQAGHQWPAGFQKITTDEYRVSGDLYLGYGAVKRQGKNTHPEYARWIEPDSCGRLLLQSPPDAEAELKLALAALHHLGGLGNRSRRAWGSASILDAKAHPPMSLQELINTSCVDIDTALSREWPNGLVRDERGPLIWQSGPIKNWQSCVDELAPLLKDANQYMRQEERARAKDTLATLGGVRPRWSSLLRLKVVRAQDKLCIRVIFLPFAMPKETGLQLNAKLCAALTNHLDRKDAIERFDQEKHT